MLGSNEQISPVPFWLLIFTHTLLSIYVNPLTDSSKLYLATASGPRPGFQGDT